MSFFYLDHFFKFSSSNFVKKNKLDIRSISLGRTRRIFYNIHRLQNYFNVRFKWDIVINFLELEDCFESRYTHFLNHASVAK